MSYPFKAAESWPRNGVPVRAIVVHMAEGGGTVSWLTRPDGNSSHYVVEYDGDIWQLVHEDRAAGSINPTALRTTDDPPFTFEGESVVYGVTAAKACLGQYWSNPNAAVIAIEVEGFAVSGPNPKQRVGLASLVADIRTRFPGTPTLGHRDFQDYKRCPGKLINWADYGGHGAAGGDVRYIKAIDGKLLPVADGQTWQTFDSPPTTGTFSAAAQVPVVGLTDGKAGAYAVEITTARITGTNAKVVVLIKSDATLVDAPAPPSATYPVTVGGKPAGSVTLP